MATLYSAIGQKQKNAETNFVNGVTDASALCNTLSVVPVIYTITGSETASDTIRLVRLPKGVQVLPHLTSVKCSADPGTALTIDVGDEYDSTSTATADADRYADGLNLASGGRVGFDSAEGVASNTAYKLEDDAWITIDPGTVTSLTADVTLTFHIAYLTA